MQWLVHTTAAALLYGSHYNNPRRSNLQRTKYTFHRQANGRTQRGYETADFANLHPLTRSLIATFLNRVCLQDVLLAVQYIRDVKFGA
jgi:hypothetical protein